MSIIHEALKKTQSTLHNPRPVSKPVQNIPEMPQVTPAKQTTQPAIPHPQTVPTPPASAPRRFSTLPLLMLSTILAIVVILQIYPPSSPRPETASVTPPPAETVPPPNAVVPVIPEIPSAPPTPPITETIIAQPEPVAANTIAIPKTENEIPDIVLQGTSITGNTRLALINDGIYEIGDRIYGKTVTDIFESEVELSDGHQTIVIKLRKNR